MMRTFILLVKRLWPASQRAQLILCFCLFTATAIFLLSAPVGAPLGPKANAPGLLAWAGCLAALAIMARLANSRAGNLRYVVSRFLLFVFLLFFLVERLARDAAPWLLQHGLAHASQWIQILSSVAVVVAGGIALPRLRSIREGSLIVRREHARFLAAAESTLDDFYIFDGVYDAAGDIVDFRFSYINPNAERRLHTPREQLIGKILTEVRPFMVSSGLIGKYREVVRTGQPFTCEVFLNDELIRATWLNVQVVRLGDGIAITSRDITESKRLTDRVQHLAHHDQLTGLANRTLLQDRLEQAILRAQRNQQKVAVFMLDIDHFKRVNDTLGHADGDALLVAIGQRLVSSVRETDTVARLGGDEFVIVMPEFRNLDEVERCGLKIIETVARPIPLRDREIHITVSAGVCIWPDCGLNIQELLSKADAAMYAVKDSGRNGLRMFDDAFVEESRAMLALADSQSL